MTDVYLSLGSNEGDRVGWLRKSVTMLDEECGPVVRQSSIYETAAWGLTEQPDFLNMVVQLQTILPPRELLAACQQIETSLGRQRLVKWGPRTLDVDILLYDGLILHGPDLVIPHPFLQDRRFTLIPLAEIAPHYMHPQLHMTISELLSHCPDVLEVRTYATAF